MEIIFNIEHFLRVKVIKVKVKINVWGSLVRVLGLKISITGYVYGYS